MVCVFLNFLTMGDELEGSLLEVEELLDLEPEMAKLAPPVKSEPRASRYGLR